MKPVSVTKLDKRNNTASKKIDDGVISVNCDVVVIFSNLWPIWSYPETGFRTQSL